LEPAPNRGDAVGPVVFGLAAAIWADPDIDEDTAQCLVDGGRWWVKQHAIDTGDRSGTTTADDAHR
jgi:hypothetical protein